MNVLSIFAEFGLIFTPSKTTFCVDYFAGNTWINTLDLLEVSLTIEKTATFGVSGKILSLF